MITLYNKATGQAIGSITEAQLQILVKHLEEESDADQDYWINREMVFQMQDAGEDAQLVSMLFAALGEQDDIDVEWKTA
jgi:hypothetical protein